MRSVAKKAGRNRVAVLPQKRFRESNSTVIHPTDFVHFIKVLQNVLQSIEGSFNRCLARLSVSKPSQLKFAQRIFGELPALFNKWCINILVAIVPGSADQRPEVSWKLQTPTRVHFNRMVEEARADNYLEICIREERTPRNVWLPNPIFISSLLPLVQFNVNLVRPVIVWS